MPLPLIPWHTMSRSIELAVQSLLSKQEPITVGNAITAYLHVANLYDEQSDAHIHDALVAFEHALDKQPVFNPGDKDTTCHHRPYLAEVAQLRRDYWTERLRDTKCTCGRCGCPVVENLPEDIAAPLKPSVQRRRKSAGNKRMSSVSLSDC